MFIIKKIVLTIFIFFLVTQTIKANGNSGEAEYISSVTPFIIMALFAGSVVFLLVFIQKRRQKVLFQEKEKFLNDNFKKREEKLKEELTNLQIKQIELNKELKFKQDEMLNMAMSIIRKNEFMETLKKQIVRYKNRTSDSETLSFLNRLLMSVIQNIASDHESEKFQMHLNEQHSNFLRRLTEKFGDMTNNEKRLAAMLRINLSSKEIASILNISPKSVEMNRYRLRKKLKVPPNKNISDFIKEF